MIIHLDPAALRALLRQDAEAAILAVAVAEAGGEATASSVARRAGLSAAAAAAAATRLVAAGHAARAGAALRLSAPLAVRHGAAAARPAPVPLPAGESNRGDGGRRSLLALRDERAAEIAACGGPALIDAAEGWIGEMAERGGGRLAVGLQLRCYDAILAACSAHGPLVAGDAVAAARAKGIDPKEGAPERYVAAVVRGIVTGDHGPSRRPGSDLAPGRKRPTIDPTPRPRRKRSDDDDLF